MHTASLPAPVVPPFPTIIVPTSLVMGECTSWPVVAVPHKSHYGHHQPEIYAEPPDFVTFAAIWRGILALAQFCCARWLA